MQNEADRIMTGLTKLASIESLYYIMKTGWELFISQKYRSRLKHVS